MKKTAKRVLALLLALTMLIAGVTAVSSVSTNDIKRKIESDYDRALSYAGRGSFHGACNLSVAYQLLAKGIYTGGYPDYAGTGRDYYIDYAYNNSAKTSGGYGVITVGGADCIRELISKYGSNLSNIVVSYGTGGSSGSVHVVLISHIIDGYIYFTDSFRYGSSPEGAARVWSVDEFNRLYRAMNGNPYGLVYYTKNEAPVNIEKEEIPDYETGTYAIVVDELNVRSDYGVSSSVIGSVDSHNAKTGDSTTYTVSQVVYTWADSSHTVLDKVWGKISYGSKTGWICLQNGSKPYAVFVPAPREELSVALISRDTQSAKSNRELIWIATVVGGSENYSYRFDLYKDGKLIQKGSYSSHKEFFYTAEINGEYQVVLLVRDSDGNTAKGKSSVVTIKSCPSVKGDINEDGKVTTADAKIALRYVAGLVTVGENAKLAGDVNNDGKITTSDIKIIIKSVAKL